MPKDGIIEIRDNDETGFQGDEDSCQWSPFRRYANNDISRQACLALQNLRSRINDLGHIVGRIREELEHAQAVEERVSLRIELQAREADIEEIEIRITSILRDNPLLK